MRIKLLGATSLALFACLALLSTCTLSADTFTFSGGTYGGNGEVAGTSTSSSTTAPPDYPSLPAVTTTVSDGGTTTCSSACVFVLSTGTLDMISGDYQNGVAPYDYQIPYSTTGGSLVVYNGAGTSAADVVFSGNFTATDVDIDAHNTGSLVGFVGGDPPSQPPPPTQLALSGMFGPASPYSGYSVDSSMSFLELSFSSFNLFSWNNVAATGTSSNEYQAVVSTATTGTLASELVLTPVPEPSSMMLIGSGLIGLAFLRRRIFNR